MISNKSTTIMNLATWLRRGLFLVLAIVLALPATQVEAAIFNNDVRDLPTVSVNNATQNPSSQNTGWGTSITARPGDVITVEVYYHNNGPQASDVARNVYTWLQVPTNVPGATQNITGGVRADNASPATGQATVSIVGGTGGETLQLVPSSVRWYPNQGYQYPQPLLNGQSGSELFTSRGVFVGDQNPGWYEQGNIGADFRVIQAAPPQPTCPTTVTQPATNITQTAATLNGSLNGVTSGGSFWFEFGTSASFGNATPPQAAQNGAISFPITNLLPGTTYYYRSAVQAPSCAPAFGAPLQFTTAAAPINFTVSTQPATNITQTAATINGTLTTNGVQGIMRWFEWGPTSALGFATSIQSGVDGPYSAPLLGLQPSTTYFFRAAAQMFNGAPQYGQTLQFTTLGVPPAQCPTIITQPATSVTLNSASLNASISGVQSIGPGYSFEFGTTPAFGQSTSPQAAQNGGVSAFAGNLNPNTLYYFRAVLQAPNCVVAYGATLQFTTGANPVIAVTTQPATGVTQNSATLNGTLTTNGVQNVQRWFEWGQSVSLGFRTANQQGTDGSFSDFLSNLQSGTTYYFRVAAQAPNASPVFGATLSFTTPTIAQPTCPTATTQAASGVTTSSAYLNGFVSNVPASGAARWFEYGTSPSFGQSTSQQTALSGNFFDLVGNLQPNTTYYFRAVVQGSGCAISFGQTQTFVTGNVVVNPPPYYPPYNPPVVPVCTPFTVTTLSPNNITDTTAQLRGSVSADSSNSNRLSVWFEYGPMPSLGQSTQQQYLNGGMFNDYILTLRPGTLYYFRAVAQNQNTGFFGSFFGVNNYCSGVHYGPTLSLTTGPGFAIVTPQPQPILIEQSVLTEPATSVTETNARMNASAVLSNQPSLGWFEWGPTVALGSKTTPADLGNYSSNTFYAFATNLQPGSTYYFRAVLQNRTTGNTIRDGILSFRTPGRMVVPPAYVPPAPPVTPVAPAVSTARVTIVKELANMSFPNGTKECVAGFIGNTIEYSINVRNAGTGPANDLVVRDVLSQYLEFKSANEGGVYDPTSRTVTWHTSLAAREAKSLTIQAVVMRVADNVVAGNTASASYGDVTKTSNVTNLIITIDPVTLALVTDKTSAGADDTINYTAIFRNESQSSIMDSVVRIIIPTATTFVSADRGTFSPADSTITLNAGDLKSKEEGRLRFSVRVNPTVRAGEILNSVVVMNYRDMIGNQQLEAHNFLPVRIGGVVAGGTGAGAAARGVSSQGLSAVFGTGFLPQTLMGWLVLIIIIILLIMLGRRAMRGDIDRTPPTSPRA